MSDYQSIPESTTERFFTVINRSTGAPITSGTVNYYLRAKSGANDGKFWDDDSETWVVAETANAMTHNADGHWEIDLTSSPFVSGTRYLEYVKESGNLHVPDARHLIGESSGAVPYSATSTSIIPRPSRVRRRNVLTLADAVDHLLRNQEINPSDTRAVERAELSVRDALESFASYVAQGFKYYESRERIVFNEPYSVGTATVSSGVVTPSTAPTWPSWVQFGSLKVGDSSYLVLGNTANTLTVSEGLPDGTYPSVTLEQAFARLPSLFRRRGSLSDSSNEYPITDVPGGLLHSWMEYYDWARSAANPRLFGSVTGDQRFHGELMLAVWPPFQQDKTLSLFYERYPASCEVHRVGSGVTIGVSGTTVTADTSVFTDDHVGSVLAVCVDDSTEITSSLSAMSLVQAKRIITQVDSGTSCTIDAQISSSALSDRTFYISDPCDVMPGPQEGAFLRLAEYEFARQSKSKPEYVGRKFKEFRQQLDIAMADDVRYRSSVDDAPRSLMSGIGLGDVNGRPS